LCCRNWCCVNRLRSWNRHCYSTWNSTGLVCTSFKLSTHWYLVCALTTLKMFPSFSRFRLLFKLTSCIIIISCIKNIIYYSFETMIDI
jgi:hypothetical protein